jgi:hypothetical protein
LVFAALLRGIVALLRGIVALLRGIVALFRSLVCLSGQAAGLHHHAVSAFAELTGLPADDATLGQEGSVTIPSVAVCAYCSHACVNKKRLLQRVIAVQQYLIVAQLCVIVAPQCVGV